MNGNKLLYSIIGGFGLVILTGGSFWMASIQTKSDVAAAKVATLETILPYLTQRLDSIDRKLERLEEASRNK